MSQHEPLGSVAVSLEVIDGDNNARVLAKFSQADLEGMMTRQEQRENAAGSSEGRCHFRLGDLRSDCRMHRSKLSNRFKVKMGDYPETRSTFRLRPLAVAKNSLVISAPLSGDRWVAANGPSNTSGQRRALIPDRRLTPPSRSALPSTGCR